MIALIAEASQTSWPDTVMMIAFLVFWGFFMFLFMQ